MSLNYKGVDLYPMYLFYGAVLIISIFVKDVYSYGYLLDASIALWLFFYNRTNINIKILAVVSILSIPVYVFFTHSSLIYFLLDFATFFCVLSCIEESKWLVFSKKHINIITGFVFIYVLLFFVLMLDPTRYGVYDNRYIGLLPSGTVASSLLMAMVIFLLEHYRLTKHVKKIFILGCVIFVFNLFICQTRSVLFLAPYLLIYFYDFSKAKRSKRVTILVSVVIIFSLYFFLVKNAESMRLSGEETSVLTRSFLYEQIFIRIQQAYYVIPYGHNACLRYIQSITSDNFSPHNDFLKYWYDWGAFGLIMLVIVFARIRKFAIVNNCKLRLATIILFVSSCALHNVLFSMLIWPIILLVLYELKSNEYKMRFNAV